MSDKKHIYKPKPISGFPEWLPETRMVEQRWMDHIRRVFESYGFCSIETPSVEEIDVITAKGEVDKEIYVLERLHKEDDDDSEARLALHFDQTVPLARYTAQHFNDLTFPFKRYQIQRVWRGERPQLGRMREFYQCDIDVINVDALPLYFDAEMPAVIHEALEGLDIGRIQIRISNRKILFGYLKSIGVTNSEQTIKITRAIDKLEKKGTDAVVIEVLEILGRYDENGRLHDEGGNPANITTLSNEDKNIIGNIKNFIKAASKTYACPDDLEDALVNNKNFDTSNPMMKEGIEELVFVLEQLQHLPDHAVVADLSIVRGLDYYTGTVYETRLLDIPEFTGSICSGGRFDDLASSYINKKLPGVGISIGFTRLFEILNHFGHIKTGPKSPSQILMVLPSEEQRASASQTARTLRERGYNVELYHAPQKLKKQLAYAEKKGISYVWFPPFEEGQDHEVKCMKTGKQSKADPENWGIDEH